MFTDRQEAGVRLAERLSGLADTEEVVVLGLPRGGVPVAFEVARALGAPMDVIVVRKLGVPFQPELGYGRRRRGRGAGGQRRGHAAARVTTAEMAEVEERERAEVDRRARRYRGGGLARRVDGRAAVIVDDGIATGGTARAACQVARAQGAARVVLAVPVAPPATVESRPRRRRDGLP